MNRNLLVFLILGTLTLVVFGCGQRTGSGVTVPPMTAGPAGPSQPGAAKPEAGGALTGELRVAVPCGIAGPYGEIKKLFESKHPGLKITQDVANIEVLTRMIADGKATPDVWLSLGDREVQTVKAADRLDGEPVTYAYNSLALMVAKDNPCQIDSVESLASPKVKTIAMATEANSQGYYMKEVLKRAGIAEKVESKLWLTPEPAKVKAQLASGKADVGVVYYPCTRETREVGGKPQEMKGKVQLLGKIPAELSGPIPAQAAVIKGCANPAAGRAFLEFLLTDEVQDIWEKWAFDRAKQPASGKRVTLYIYCGAGIRPFLDKAIEAYTAANPHIRIDAGYAGSGCLLSQLTFARRGDLYLPGEDFYLNQAHERGYTEGDRLIGFLEPVILVQKGNPKGIRGVEDLAKPGMRVGLGEPGAAAIGIAAEEILKKANLLERVEKNVKFRAGNVPELGNHVKLKQLDAAIVWNITAAQVQDACDTVPIAQELYKPSHVPVALLKFSQHKQEARAFMDYLAGPEGQRMAEETGMTPAAKGAAGA